MLDTSAGEIPSDENVYPPLVTGASTISESPLPSVSLALLTSFCLSSGKPSVPSQDLSQASSGSGQISLDLLEQINKLCEDRVSTVNYGGCAYYAAMISHRFSELGWPCKVAAIEYAPPHGANHVFIVFDVDNQQYMHDGLRTLTIEEWDERFGYGWDFTEDDPTTIVQNNRWNTWFSPFEGVPALCEIIEQVLGPYDTRPHFVNMLQGVSV